MKKKILIISAESWRDDSNGGNVLSNLFLPLKDHFEFAQIFTSPSMPVNKVCKRYFHLSESEMIKSLYKNQSFGKVLIYDDYPSGAYSLKLKKQSGNYPSFVECLKKIKLPIFQTIRNVAWYLSKWKSKQLVVFVKEYNPDIIFAPMYGGLHMHWLDRFIATTLEKKIISYVSDDHLTFKQYSLSPFFWLNRILLRKAVFKTSNHYSLLYTMTVEQKNEYEKILNVPMKILMKGGDFTKKTINKTINYPVKIIYAGGLYLNRDFILSKVVDALDIINKDVLRAQLHIYTQSEIHSKYFQKLNNGRSSVIKGCVSADELNSIYKESDIALHVESFDKKNRLLTRLSFSTKIVDLFQSGSCIMAICWNESSPYKYLLREDAAICIDDPDKILEHLTSLINNPTKIKLWGHKAWECGKRNHDKTIIRDSLLKELISFK